MTPANKVRVVVFEAVIGITLIAGGFVIILQVAVDCIIDLLHYWMYLGTYIGTYLPTSIPFELYDTFQHIPANPTKSVTL
jgi:hypothetical protein